MIYNQDISVIIPTMKGREDMLERLKSTIPDWCEVIVVDDEDLLLAAKRNKGARLATKNNFLFIDDDNYLKENALQSIDSRNEYAGAIGLTACYHDKKLVVADGGSMRNYLTGMMKGVRTGNFISREKIYWAYKVDEVANAFMIPREVFEEVGGFDEDNFPIDLDEADICKRIKDHGYNIYVEPSAICYHKSQTYSCIPDFRRPMNAYFMGRNKILFQRKHSNFFAYMFYLLTFMPITVVGYFVALTYRKKPMMFLHFLKGVFDGIRGCKKNKFQKS